MPFKSKAQVARWAQLVADGQMKKSIYDKMLRDTKDVSSLPERIGTDEKPKPVVDPKRIGGKYR